jgi:hypothetical protein
MMRRGASLATFLLVFSTLLRADDLASALRLGTALPLSQPRFGVATFDHLLLAI